MLKPTIEMRRPFPKLTLRRKKLSATLRLQKGTLCGYGNLPNFDRFFRLRSWSHCLLTRVSRATSQLFLRSFFYLDRTFVKTFQPATSKGHLDLYQTEDNTFQIIKHVNKNKHFGWRLLLECRKALERNPSSYCLGARVSNHPSELLVTMPLIDGNDLLEFINARGYLSLNEALKIFRDVAEGIAHIHSLGYAHMDVALENVMIEVDSNPEQQIRRAIVIDLDFAIPLDTETGRRHAEKATNKCDGEFHPLITGRAMYMAPELINQRLRSLRESCNLRKADVYSLGVLFYTAWYCEYLSPHGDAWENVKNITTDVPHRDSPSLNELISDMVRPDPEKRPSAMEIQSRLEAMLKLGGGDENTDAPCCLVH